MIYTTSFPDIVSDVLGNLDAVIMQKMQQPLVMSQFFNHRNCSDQKYIKDTGLTGVGNPAIRAEGESSHSRESYQKFDKTYTPDDYSEYVKITWEMIKFQQYITMKKLMSEMAFAHQHVDEQAMADVFNNAFDTDYKGGDGLPLCSTAHLLVPAGTQANRPTTGSDLSVGAAQTLMNLMKNLTDDFGRKRGVVAKRFLYPSALYFLAHELFGSPDRPDTANRSINQLNREGVTPIEGPLLNDDDAFFFLPASNEEHDLNWVEREAFTTEAAYDPFTRSSYVISHRGFDVGWNEPGSIVGNPGGD